MEQNDVIRIRKALDSKVYPAIKTMLKRRDDAKEALKRVEALTVKFIEEQRFLETSLPRLRESRKELLVRGEDISAISAEARLETIRAFLPDPRVPGADNTTPQRNEVSKTNRELTHHALACIRPIQETVQAQVNELTERIEEVIAGFETAVGDFCAAHRLEGQVSFNVWIKPKGDYIKFSRAISLRR